MEPIIVRENLISRLQELAKARRSLRTMKNEIKQIEFDHAVFSDAKIMSKLVTAIDADLRSVAIEFYEITKDKQPVDGLTIKEVKAVEFDPKDVYIWALSKLVTSVAGAVAMGQNKEQIVNQLANDATFLVLDTEAFEKSVLGGLGGLPGKLVTKPQPNVASDLDVFYG